MAALTINIEDSAGAVQGSGPIASASVWKRTAKLDAAGTFSFDMPAADNKANLLASKRIARCYSTRNGARADLGSGTIDSIAVKVDPSAVGTLTVSGNDLLDELSTRIVGTLVLSSSGSPVSIASAVASIIALAPSGWTADTTTYVTAPYPANTDTIYLKFANETVLTALAKVAAQVGHHFRLGSGRQVVWLYDQQPSSGVRCISAADGSAVRTNTAVALITDLQQVRDSHELATKVYIFGSGNEAARSTLVGTTRSNAGYTLNTTESSLARDASVTTYGTIEKVLAAKDTRAIGTTGTDAVSTADALYDQAYEYLRTHSDPHQTYHLKVTKLDTVVPVGTTVQVVHKKMVGSYMAIDINATLVVLQTDDEVRADGSMATVGMTVSTTDKPSFNGTEAIKQAVQTIQSLDGHLQVAAEALHAMSATTATTATTATVYNTVRANGTALTQRGALNLISSAFDVVDDSGGNETELRFEDPATTTFLKDEFIFGGTTSGTIGELRWFSTGWATIADQNGGTGHSGVYRLTTPATSGLVCALYAKQTASTGMATTDPYLATWIVRPSPTGLMTGASFRFGLLSDPTVDATGANATNGVFVEYRNGDSNWQVVYRSGSAETSRVDLGASYPVPTANTFVRLAIRRISATQIGLTIGSGTEGVATVASVSALACMPVLQVVPSSAAAKSIDVDRFGLRLSGFAR